MVCVLLTFSIHTRGKLPSGFINLYEPLKRVERKAYLGEFEMYLIIVDISNQRHLSGMYHGCL